MLNIQQHKYVIKRMFFSLWNTFKEKKITLSIFDGHFGVPQSDNILRKKGLSVHKMEVGKNKPDLPFFIALTI